MSTHRLRIVVAFTAAVVPSAAWAQHERHQGGAPQASPELAQCRQVQPVINNIIAAATTRLETARLSNNPSEMRAAVEHLETALRDIRAQLAPCSAAAAGADPHGGHTMPSTQPPAATPATQTPGAAAVPHTGHATPGPPAGSKAAPASKPALSKPASPSTADPHAGHAKSGPPSASAPTSKPAPGKPSTPRAADPHAGHATPGTSPARKPTPSPVPPKPGAPQDAQPHAHAGRASELPAGKQMDPVNGLIVDPSTAPKTTYQGQTYYFSSEQSRKEFLENPAKFAKKPKG